MNKKNYSTAIKKTPFKYVISKKIAKLMLDGLNYDEVYNKCFNENYIEIDSIQRRSEITNVIYERLNGLDFNLLNLFYNGDIGTSKFILVYAIAKNDSLFFEFMFEIYRDALLSENKYISNDNFEIFFRIKSEMNTIVSKWGHFTFEQLAKGYKNILVDSGLGIRVKNNIKVIKAIVHPIVEEHIKLIKDTELLQALLGEDS